MQAHERVHLFLVLEIAISHLEKMIALVEQYYHPSNGGKWTKGLCLFLKNLIKHFMSLLAQKVSAHFRFLGAPRALI